MREVKLATCGHYVFAETESTKYFGISNRVRHHGDGADIVNEEVPITLCAHCVAGLQGG